MLLLVFSGKDCGFPGRPGNGTTIGAEKFFYPGEEVTFECDNGYILFGGDRRICQEDGSWSGSLPECSKIQFYELDNSIHNMSVKLCYILASYNTTAAISFEQSRYLPLAFHIEDGSLKLRTILACVSIT